MTKKHRVFKFENDKKLHHQCTVCGTMDPKRFTPIGGNGDSMLCDKCIESRFSPFTVRYDRTMLPDDMGIE